MHFFKGKKIKFQVNVNFFCFTKNGLGKKSDNFLFTNSFPFPSLPIKAIISEAPASVFGFINGDGFDLEVENFNYSDLNISFTGEKLLL